MILSILSSSKFSKLRFSKTSKHCHSYLFVKTWLGMYTSMTKINAASYDNLSTVRFHAITGLIVLCWICRKELSRIWFEIQKVSLMKEKSISECPMQIDVYFEQPPLCSFFWICTDFLSACSLNVLPLMFIDVKNRDLIHCFDVR